MARWFPLVRRKTRTVEVPVDSEEVTGNKVRFDLLEKLARLRTSVATGLRTFERVSFSTTDAIVLLVTVRDQLSTVVTPFVRAVATVGNSISTVVSNFIGLRAFERLTATLWEFIGLRVFETVRTALRHVVGLRVVDRLSARLQHFIGLRAFATCSAQFQHLVGLRAFETATFVATPSVGATATVNAPAEFRDSTAVAPKVTVRTEAQVALTFEATTFGSGAGGYAESIDFQTNVNNPNNLLGNTTGTSATAVATSSGIGGLTSNTVNFQIQPFLPDVDLNNLLSTIDQVKLHMESSGSVSGVSVGGEGEIDHGWRSPRGGTLTVFHSAAWDTLNEYAKAIHEVDLTSQIDSWTKLNGLAGKFQGSVTSGTGLGATSTAHFYRCWYEFTGTGSVANA